jgi:uncharacterized protein (TIGR02246 family)
MHAITLLIIAGLTLAGPAAAQDKDTIQKINDRFETAFNSGDMGALGQLYTEDAYLMPPQADFVRGRDDIKKFWTAASEQVGDLQLTTLDVKPMGSDAAREVGTFTMKTKGQQAQEVVGKYVVVWQREGSDWKLATDIWNTNK